MSDEVLGNWKGFTFKKILPPDYPAVLQHLKDFFFCDEPVQNVLRLRFGITKEEICERFVKSIPARLSENLSFMAVDIESGALACVKIQQIWTEEMTRKSSVPLPTTTSANLSPSMKAYRHGLGKLMEKSEALFPKIHEAFGVSVAALSFATSTATGFRQQGLAAEMYRRMNLLLKEEGYSVCFSVFTCPWSRRAAEKNGFYELDPGSRDYWVDVRDEQDQPLLPNADPADYSSLLVCKL